MNITSKEYFTFNVDNSALLVGQTGSGKSELVRSYIRRLEKAYTPDQMKYVIFDLKQVEFSVGYEDGAKEEYLYHSVLPGDLSPEQTQDYLDELAELSEKRAKEDNPAPLIFIYIEECDMAFVAPERFSKAVKTINKNAAKANMKLIYSTSRPAQSSFPDDMKDSFDLILAGELASDVDRNYIGVPLSISGNLPRYGFVAIDNKGKK